VAKPDTDDGWFKIAVELEAALAYASFSKVARVLIAYVFIQTFGRGTRPKLAYLPQKLVADRIGQKTQAVCRAIRELVDSGVLVEAKDDQYRFVKDYEKWATWSRDPAKEKQPRLTRKEIKDCKSMPDYAESFRIKGYPDPQESGVNQVVTADVTNGLHGVNQVVTADVTNGLHGVNQVVTGSAGAIEDRTRGQREKREKYREGERAPAPRNRNPSLSQIRAAEQAARGKAFEEVFATLAETDPIDQKS
jgi:hypothetical protein